MPIKSSGIYGCLLYTSGRRAGLRGNGIGDRPGKILFRYSRNLFHSRDCRDRFFRQAEMWFHMRTVRRPIYRDGDTVSQMCIRDRYKYPRAVRRRRYPPPLSPDTRSCKSSFPAAYRRIVSSRRSGTVCHAGGRLTALLLSLIHIFPRNPGGLHLPAKRPA